MSLYGGYFTGETNLDSIKETANCFVLNLTVGAGISFPINKLNLELGLSQNYQLINIKLLKEFFAGDFSNRTPLQEMLTISDF